MVPRLALVLVLLLGAGTAAPRRIPPLNELPTEVNTPGRFIWTDILSTEPNATARFYRALFDWTPRTFTDDQGKYIVLSSTNGPVVGVARGPERKNGRPSTRWLGYLATDDMMAAVTAVKNGGGRILAGPDRLPERGQHVVAFDPQGALFGLMDSASGDPPDSTGGLDEPVWYDLVTTEPAGAADFYGEVVGLQSRRADPASLVLASQGKDRAGISSLGERNKTHPTWVPFIRVAELDRKLKLARRLGARILRGEQTGPGGVRWVVLADTMGGAFALTEFTGPKGGN